MQIYERINAILRSKKLKKKDFVQKFIDLEPRLKSTGEVPSLPSIYNYLNGNREVKAELIPYIAKALEVSEQELFIDDLNISSFLKDIVNKCNYNDKEYEKFTKHKSYHRSLSICFRATLIKANRNSREKQRANAKTYERYFSSITTFYSPQRQPYLETM